MSRNEQKLPGDPTCYRAYVGWPQQYDYYTGIIFGMLFDHGLREQHSLLDVGCGSLRVGRVLIPYLLPGKYHGIEPNQYILEQGIENEIGNELIHKKQACLYLTDNARDINISFDYILLHSIFSHTGMDLLQYWMSEIKRLLKQHGIALATYFPATHDCQETGWIYGDGKGSKGTIEYTHTTINVVATQNKLSCKIIAEKKPTQTWVLIKHK